MWLKRNPSGNEQRLVIEAIEAGDELVSEISAKVRAGVMGDRLKAWLMADGAMETVTNGACPET